MLLFDAAYVVPNKGTNFILIYQYYILFLSLEFVQLNLGKNSWNLAQSGLYEPRYSNDTLQTTQTSLHHSIIDIEHQTDFAISRVLTWAQNYNASLELEIRKT